MAELEFCLIVCGEYAMKVYRHNLQFYSDIYKVSQNSKEVIDLERKVSRKQISDMIAYFIERLLDYDAPIDFKSKLYIKIKNDSN